MTGSALDRDLALRLEAIRKQHGDTIRVDQLGEFVHAMLDTLSGDMNPADLRLYRELEQLVGYIHNARAEIASLRPKDIQDKYIASATDELDAIVAATESATNQILDTMESIEGLQGSMEPDAAAKLVDYITRVYEACNFQDITGQRITKVVKALKHIEERIEALVSAFGSDLPEPPAAAEAPRPITDADLLNGPQLDESAQKQADIDKLFAS
jgi:chemotaxis protein CheZ